MSDNIIQLNEDLIKNNLKDLVRSSVEETLNALLDHEADELVNADKYERSGDRKGYRSGHYERNFSTTSGNVTLKVPKLKGIQFKTAIIERYKRRECSVEEALIEMYLAFTKMKSLIGYSLNRYSLDTFRYGKSRNRFIRSGNHTFFRVKIEISTFGFIAYLSVF